MGEAETASPILLEEALAAATDVAPHQHALPRHEKARQCQAIADGIHQNHESLARLITRESGKPIQYSRGEVDRAVTTFTLAAHEALRFTGEQIPLDITPSSTGLTGHFNRVPLGPVAAIAPFNFPLNLVAHKIAPALAVGTPIILKPAVQTPLTALRLAEIIDTAKVLPGTVSIMPMENPTAELMVRDDRPGVFSFTGSGKIGWHLKSIAGRKHVLLELGGNAPAIVHEDADVPTAARKLATAAFAAAGQVCIKAQRLIIHEAIYESFVSHLIDATAKISAGDPSDDATIVGPVIDQTSANRIIQWVDEAISAGSTLLCGHTRSGNVIAPTLLADVPPHTKCAREEIFGPVAILQKYAKIDEAIHLANNSDYGLQASIFTYDTRIIHHATHSLNYGGIIINDTPMVRVDNYPYGGMKASGTGREGVRHTMEEYTQTKAIIQRHP